MKCTKGTHDDELNNVSVRVSRWIHSLDEYLEAAVNCKGYVPSDITLCEDASRAAGAGALERTWARTCS